MEPGWLLLFVPTVLVTGLFAWSFGAWRNATATAVLAWIGLVVTVCGVVLAAAVWGIAVASQRSAQAAHSHYEPFTGLFVLVGLLVTLGIEWFGACLTLAVCLIGLRQTSRRETGWYVALLVGGLLPMVGVLVSLVFQPALDWLLAPFYRSGLMPWGLQVVRILAPVVAAIVTTSYAARAAARARAAQHVPA